jgi:ABC-type polysaccharide/polyol phosphate export permease
VANVIHLFVQLGLLIVIGLFYGVYPNWYWLWLPLLWALELICIMGLGLATAALHVVIRDTRYVVESINTILFWLVPVFYTFAMVPDRFKELYQYNPVSALVLASRLVILEHRHPPETLLWKLSLVAVVSLVLGAAVFRRLKPRFYSYL